jgi:hypothetical protein
LPADVRSAVIAFREARQRLHRLGSAHPRANAAAG